MGQDIPLVGPIINKLFGSRNERFVKRYTTRVDQISAQESDIRSLTDEQIRAKTVDFRERFKQGESAGDLLIDAFAVAREAMDRAVGIRNIFDPKHREAFPADQLPANIKALYDQTLAKIDAAQDRAPEGDLLGGEEPVPAWQWIDIPLEIYDAVRELFPESRPPFRARPFDVQLIGGVVLYQGRVAEMKTGEGKTIVAPLAAYLASIEGFKVHVVTVNDYLVQRDRDWTFPYFHALGLTIGAIHPSHMQSEDIKRRMYECDLVYGTTAEFGFDYMRDNMKRSVDQQVQRVREYAIVDEVDSILIDEARTPLIISGPAHEDQPRYELADNLAKQLVEIQKPWTDADKNVDQCKNLIKGTEGDIRNAREKEAVPALQKKLEDANKQLPILQEARDQFVQYFEIEEERKTVHLTHRGTDEAQKQAGVGSFYVGENTDVPHLLEQALRAHAVYVKDKDYVILPVPDQQTGQTDMSIVIVDPNTGRPMYGRQWSDGLHQSIEAKEGVKVKQETQTVASITIQNFFKMYKKLAGMTGTADTEAQELHDIYGLDVVVIPTNVPVIREDHDDVVYLTEKDKWEAIVDEIKAFHDTGRPVLVGTTSVEKSEMLAKMLSKKYNINHNVLNAKQHEREANIVESAGHLGAVMIATNMAGRGTDIKLSKLSREQLREHWLKRSIAPRELSVEDDETTLRAKVFAKVAPTELGMNKRDVEQMSPDEIGLALLRHWAVKYTWLEEKKTQSMSADECRTALDEQGRFTLHRISWTESIEQLGGLHVIGTERHESRRIDNQLRGRCGRQGDQGSSRFFVALDDDLMRMFAGDTTTRILSRLGMKEGDAIEHPILSKSIVRAQRKVEERNFHGRKNILEYDEVMEHQRQDFYAQRQRALEGRDLREMIFDFVEAAAVNAVGRFLDKDYFAECVAEFAREKLNCSIPIDRLRGKDAEDMDRLIRREAVDDARHEIDVTIGEYLAEGSEPVDQDLAGFSRWAEDRFAVEIKAADVHEHSTAEIKAQLLNAASQQIDGADLEGIDQFLAENYGPLQLCKWLEHSLIVKLDPEKVAEKETHEEIVDLVLDKVRDAYDKREAEYPVDFQMQMTMARMRQSPEQAGAYLVEWVNKRYGLEWEDSILRTKMPQQIQDDLVRAQKQYIESGKLEQAIDAAVACKTSEQLVAHFKTEYDIELPHWVLRLQGEDREAQVRARVEGILRAELVQFERFVLLEVFDPAWKDHLYQMDQLRDTIGFRAFSQQDPRIEYKREGARMYQQLLETMRDRITEYLFRLRVVPQITPPGGQAGPSIPPNPQPQPVGAGGPRGNAGGATGGAGGAGGVGGGIAGPGIA